MKFALSSVLLFVTLVSAAPMRRRPEGEICIFTSYPCPKECSDSCIYPDLPCPFQYKPTCP